MWIPPSGTGRFTSRFRYVEVMRYFPRSHKPARELVNGQVLIDVNDVEVYARQHNYLGIYQSIFSCDNQSLDRASRLGSFYVDLDSLDVGEAQGDAIRLVDYLADFLPEYAIQIYFSGLKGFHIECEAVALGIGPSADLPGLFRYITTKLREELELHTVDFVVYEYRRMWRLANSRHQKSGLYKIKLTPEELRAPIERLKELAEKPRDMPVPDQVFDAGANEWYREWQYKFEDSKAFTIEQMIARFKTHGSRTYEFDNDELLFTPIKLFENCPAILRLWEKAESEHNLTHEERLFLCSILTYTEEAKEYLFAILRSCDDYNEAKSRAHIEDWVRRRERGTGGHPYSCARANAAGVGCGTCDLEPKERYVQVGGRLVSTGEMAAPSPLRFGYKRNKNSPKS